MKIVDYKWVEGEFIVVIKCKCDNVFELNTKIANALCRSCKNRRTVEYLFSSFDELTRAGKPKQSRV